MEKLLDQELKFYLMMGLQVKDPEWAEEIHLQECLVQPSFQGKSTTQIKSELHRKNKQMVIMSNSSNFKQIYNIVLRIKKSEERLQC